MMYKVFPSLILRAAMVRARTLELGSVLDHHTSSSAPSSSTLVAAAPSATNVYVLAYGEREGLAPGERLEVYGGTVRLVRTLAYGCPRGATVESAFTGRLSMTDLQEITEQLDAVRACGPDMRKLSAAQLQRAAASVAAKGRSSSQLTTPPSSSPSSPSNTAAAQQQQQQQCRRSEWRLRLPEIKHSQVLRRTLPDDAVASLSGAHLEKQIERLRRSTEEIVVAEWVSCTSDQHNKNNNSQGSARMGSDGMQKDTRRPASSSSAAAAATGQSTAAPADSKNKTTAAGVIDAHKKLNELDKNKHKKSGAAVAVAESEEDALLMENGVCFRNPDSCGLRALRTARLAFISSIERTANGLARRQRRHSNEESRALAVLDVSAIDFTFAHAALQSTLELGLHSGEGCRIAHIPLTDYAAQQVESQAASYIRVVAAGPGRALQRPFEFVPTHNFDVGAYTAYLPLPLGPLTAAEAAGSCQNLDAEDARQLKAHAAAAAKAAKATRGRQSQSNGAQKDGIGGTRADRQQLAVQLSQALATLRKGACMLVTFVATPNTVAALYHEMETQHHAEVLVEHRMVARSKACLAEAIARTGRWGYITDEVLPPVDSPQGSSFSLMVVLE